MNASKQHVSSPPFGSSEFLLRTPPELKQGHKLLEAFSSFPVYSNAATALHPIDQRKKVPVAMQYRNPSGSVLWSHTYVRCMEATQDNKFSINCLCEEDRWQTPAGTKVGFSLRYTEHVLRHAEDFIRTPP